MLLVFNRKPKLAGLSKELFLKKPENSGIKWEVIEQGLQRIWERLIETSIGTKGAKST